MSIFLVTGGCGFVGGHLVAKLLTEGHAARVLDNLSTGRRANLPAGVELMVGDVTNRAVLAKALAGTAGCYHLAAVASARGGDEDWIETHRTNLTGTICVFDAARENRLPVVYASSAAVYGDQAVMPITETAHPRPLTVDGADKLGCELHARVAGAAHGVPTMGLRLFEVYGPGREPAARPPDLISTFIDRLLSGQPIDLPGDGYQTRDFIYVDDVVEHLIAGMRQASVEAPVLNVCTGRATSIRRLVTLLRDLTGGQGDIRVEAARADDARSSIGSPVNAIARLGVSARTRLEVGLSLTVAAGARPLVAAE